MINTLYSGLTENKKLHCCFNCRELMNLVLCEITEHKTRTAFYECFQECEWPPRASGHPPGETISYQTWIGESVSSW